MEYAHARYRREREQQQQQSQQRFRFGERERDTDTDTGRDRVGDSRRPSSPPHLNGTPSSAPGRSAWREEDKLRAIASALATTPRIGNGWPTSGSSQGTPARPPMTVQNHRGRQSPPAASAPSAYGRDRPTFGNAHRPEARDVAGRAMHHNARQNGNRRMNGRPRSLSPPLAGGRGRGGRFDAGPGASATIDDLLPYDEPQSSYSRQGVQEQHASPRRPGGRPHNHGGPSHGRQPPSYSHKPDFQQRGREAAWNDRERGMPPQYPDSDRDRSMPSRPSYYENGGPPPSAFGKRARYDPEAFGKRGPSVDNGWAGARARGGARRRNGSPFSSVSEDGRRSRRVSGPTQYPAQTDDGRHSERAVSPDRMSNSTSARSRGRRSPSPLQDPLIPPLRSPASNAGSSHSHSQSRSDSERPSAGFTSEREQLSLSARISGFPARTGPNGAGPHEDRFSAPPQTAHHAAFSAPRSGNRRDRPPLGRERDEPASRDSSPRSARSMSISQSPRLPHVLSQSVHGSNGSGKMPWGSLESRPRRASASPPRAPLSARQVASEFQSPRSLRDRLGPPADPARTSTEQVVLASRRSETEADQAEREEEEMRSEMENEAMDEEPGLTPPPRILPSKQRILAPPVKVEPELELEGQAGQLSVALSDAMEAPHAQTLADSSAASRRRRSGTPPGRPSRPSIPPASPMATAPAPLAASAQTDQRGIQPSPSPLDGKVQPVNTSTEVMRSPVKQEVTSLLSPKQENERPSGQTDAPLGSPSTASTTSPPPTVLRSLPSPAKVPRTASQLEPLRAPAPLRQAAATIASDVSLALPKKQDIGEVERSVASSSPPAQGVETANTSQESTVADLSMITDSQKRPASQERSPDALQQRDCQPDLAKISEQASVNESPRAEEDGMQVEEDFDRTLLSIIELEDSRDDMDLDPVDIIDDNRYRLGMTLPVALPTVGDREGRFSVADPELGNYNLLEPFLHRSMEERDIRRGIKIVRLQQQYRELETEWRAHCKHLEKIQTRQKRRLAAAAPPLTPSIDASGLPFITTPATPSILAPSGRANRRAANTLGYSDAARSEAEFLEILARLEDADMADPNLRAMRTTATVPDMVIDAGERDLSSLQTYEDENGLVGDPLDHYGINKSPDNWTEDEIAIFCRRYALYPKQFGKIGAALPDKTTPQCVLFYYRSKKKIDFRALVDKRSRDGKRKKGKRGAGDKGADDAAAGQQKKGPSLLGNLKRSRVQEEDEEDEEDEPQTPGSAIAQESAVLSTAKALTRQLHGVIAPADTNEPPGIASLSDALDSATPSAARLLPSRQPSYAKKAARFLSPPAAIDGGDEGLVPASDGALAAAEALEVLANGLLDLGSAPALGPAPGKTAANARSKKRKPSISDPAAMAAGSLVEEGASRSSTATGSKRARPSTSSYWSVADKNEFTRLLRLHGKNFNGISEGLGSKTAIQCKNFFQNNAKKMGLSEIAAAVDGEDQTLTRASEVLIEELEMPSVFATPEESATFSHDHHPTAGYFVPVTEEEGNGEQYSHPNQKQGGMHLRHLLDDAPDAEGGAALHQPDFQYPTLASRARAEDYDSSTEDEADLAGRFQQTRRDSAAGSHFVAADRSRGEAQLPHSHHQPLRANGVPQPGGDYYKRTIYDDSNHSPDYTVRDQISPAYPTPLANERNFSGPLPPLKARYAAFPPPRQWSPYDSRTIYSQPTPSISSFYRSTSVGAMPAGAAPHIVSQAHEADYGDESRHFSPPPRTSFYRGQAASIEAEHDNGRGLPPLVSAGAKGTAPHYSPYYEAVATPPLYGPPSSSLRQSEGPDNFADSSRQYDHYGAYRGQ